IDRLWTDHLEMMDHARSSVNLRAYGQREPVVEYKREGLRLFRDLEENYMVQVADIMKNLEPGNGHTAPEPPAEPAYTSQASMYTDEETNAPANTTLLIHGSLLVATVRSGMMLVHVRRAQERIWYERLQENQANHNIAAQRLLFPVTCEWPPQDAVLLHEVLPALHSMGLDISPFGQNTFVIHSVPAGMASGSEQQIVEEILEQIKNESNPSVDVLNDKLLATMARRLSRDSESIVQPEAQQALIDELFACAYPDYTPDGQKVFVMIKKETLENMLG
ncbi:MAG: hypothetical protein EBZ77_07510, partial [Chitinophagia bacterium]|nr:hypothetical protein [Chitinophagia bacterium]